MANTTAYYHAAYLIIGVIYAGYMLSLWRRSRRTMARLRTLMSTRR